MPVGVSTGTIREPFETRACLYLLLRCSVFACKDTVQSIDLTNFFATFFQKILQNYLSVLIFRYLAYSNRYAVAGIPFPCPPLLILRTVVMLVILSYCQS